MIKLLSFFVCVSALLSLSLATRSESIVGCYEHHGSRLSIYDNGKAYTDVDRCNVFDWFYDEDKQLLRLCNPQCYVRGPTDPCRSDSLLYEVEFDNGNLCLKPKSGSDQCRSALNTERWEWTRCAECLESCECSTDCRELSGCYASDDKKYLVVGEHQLVITGRHDLCVKYFYESNRSAITIGQDVCDTKCCDEEAFYFCDIRPDHTVLYYYNHECKEYLGTTWTSVSSNKRECCDYCSCKDESSYGSHDSSDSRGSSHDSSDSRYSAHDSSKDSWGKGSYGSKGSSYGKGSYDSHDSSCKDESSYGSHDSSDSRGSAHDSSKGSYGKSKGSYGSKGSSYGKGSYDSHDSSDSRGSAHDSSKGSWGKGKGSYGSKGSSYGSKGSYGSKESSDSRGSAHYGSKGSSYGSKATYGSKGSYGSESRFSSGQKGHFSSGRKGSYGSSGRYSESSSRTKWN